MNNTANQSQSSIGSLLRELRDETATLLRQEVALAKAELGKKTAEISRNAVQVAVGGFVAYAGVIVLLIGLGHLLGAGLERLGADPDLADWLAPSLIGLIVAGIGWGMFAKAKKALSAEGLAPEKTLQSLRENKEWAQHKLQHTQ